MLYDLTDGVLTKVSGTTFREEKVLERTHLQRAIRDNIEVLGGNLLVVAEEFGDFEEAHRRIDLLCVDRHARLVVVELKRTEDGGHMDLQALRYAAMVSTMTFEGLCSTYAEHLRRTGALEHDPEDARLLLEEWFEDAEGEPVLGQEVGIVLASANFSQQITTTVLWLNDQYGTDIRCIRLSPYWHQGLLLLDVQQLVPLPEAADFTVRLKRHEAAARLARESNRDYTKYVIITPNMDKSQPLAKRRAILFLVQALHAANVAADLIAKAVPDGKMRSVPGTLDGDQLWNAFRDEHGLTEQNRVRWFFDHPLHDGERTWVLFSNWGTNTEMTLGALAATAPGFSYRQAGTV
ncbi:MAG: hypothetical protein J2P19_17405 [Pseudonocardia sp.]|nr:hypothetical protein [Pseudonocardia sp.]